ncbi:MAG: hypothetical protein H6715_06330 [Myxococcales bacterium]|nr:hypothetical protein [Myxococcales bacterium]MCB9709192.1 hypothetical protein [Myxococcales bacterium]
MRWNRLTPRLVIAIVVSLLAASCERTSELGQEATSTSAVRRTLYDIEVVSNAVWHQLQPRGVITPSQTTLSAPVDEPNLAMLAERMDAQQEWWRIAYPPHLAGSILKSDDVRAAVAVSSAELLENQVAAPGRFSCPVFTIGADLRLMPRHRLAAGEPILALGQESDYAPIINNDGSVAYTSAACVREPWCPPDGAPAELQNQPSAYCMPGSFGSQAHHTFRQATLADLAQNRSAANRAENSILNVLNAVLGHRPVQTPYTVVADPRPFLEWLFVGAELRQWTGVERHMLEQAAIKILTHDIELVSLSMEVYPGLEGYPTVELSPEEFTVIALSLDAKYPFGVSQVAGGFSTGTQTTSVCTWHRAATPQELHASLDAAKQLIENYSLDRVTRQGTELHLVGYEARLRQLAGLSPTDAIVSNRATEEAIHRIAQHEASWAVHHLTRLFGREYAVTRRHPDTMTLVIRVGTRTVAGIVGDPNYAHSHPTDPSSRTAETGLFCTVAKFGAILFYDPRSGKWRPSQHGDLFTILTSVNRDNLLVTGASLAQLEDPEHWQFLFPQNAPPEAPLATYTSVRNLQNASNELEIKFGGPHGRATLEVAPL